MKTKRKPVYGASVNMAGLYHTKPIRCKWDDNLKTWWSADGNFDVKELGLSRSAGGLCITFASRSRRQVQIWIDGIQSGMTLLNSWCSQQTGA